MSVHTRCIYKDVLASAFFVVFMGGYVPSLDICIGSSTLSTLYHAKSTTMGNKQVSYIPFL